MARVPLAVVIASGSYHYEVCQYMHQALFSAHETYLQIHSDTVPEVHSDKVRIVARVEGAASVVELVAECECLRLAVDIFASHGTLWCIRINQASADALQ